MPPPSAVACNPAGGVITHPASMQLAVDGRISLPVFELQRPQAMTHPLVDIHKDSSRGRSRVQSAEYIGVSPTTFDRMVKVATPTGDLTFLVTEHGQPFTAAGFGNWFRDRCNEAGRKGLSAHGMRKAAAWGR